jgi:HK97 gp10 family phage protein
MAEQFVTGLAKLMTTLVGITKAVESQVVEVVEKNAVRVKNHAKADHTGKMAHAIGRYTNQTTNLTNSIQSTSATNSGGVISAEVRTNKEYAAKVEFGTSRTAAYPFMQPASRAIEPRFLADLKSLKIGE